MITVLTPLKSRWTVPLTPISPKSCKSTSSLNTLHTAESHKFYSTFSLTTNSVIRRCCQKSQVCPRFFADDGQYNIKKRAITKRALNFAAHFRQQRSGMLRAFKQKWGIIKIFEYLSEFEKDCQHCLLHCVWYLLMIYEWVNVAKNKVK